MEMYHNLIKLPEKQKNKIKFISLYSFILEDLALFFANKSKGWIERYRMSKKDKGLNKWNSVGSALGVSLINAKMRTVYLHNPANDFWFPESLVEA